MTRGAALVGSDRGCLSNTASAHLNYPLTYRLSSVQFMLGLASDVEVHSRVLAIGRSIFLRSGGTTSSGLLGSIRSLAGALTLALTMIPSVRWDADIDAETLDLALTLSC